MRAIAAFLIGLLFGGLVEAQQSSGYRLTERLFNEGGHPANGSMLLSPSYHMSLDAIGESIVSRRLASASYGIESGFVSVYPPPAEVHDLRFSDPTTLTWRADPSIGFYNLYRNPLHTLPGLEFGQCEQADIDTETTTAATEPTPGAGFFYLITAENRLAEEGTKGWTSSNEERANASPCP